MGILQMKGPKNIRDLGGIVNSDGKIIKDKLFIRSDHLSRLSQHDSDILVSEYNLKKIIDLRSDNEKVNRQDVIIKNIEYFNIPIFEQSTMGVTGGMGADVFSAVKQSKSKKELLDYIPDLNVIYPMMIKSEYSVKKLSEAIHIITDNRDGSVLFHCTAGKDRTGVIAALILEMLNVPRETIFEDYIETNIASMKNAKKYSKMAYIFMQSKDIADKTKKAFSADPSYLNSFYNAIYERYGSIKSFIYDGLEYSDLELCEFREYSLN